MTPGADYEQRDAAVLGLAASVVLVAAALFFALEAPRAAAVRPLGAVPNPGPGAPLSGAPIRLEIPALGVRAPIVAVGVGADHSLGVPGDPRLVGWWRPPSQRAGGVVLDGHVDAAGGILGALFHLERLRPGDAILLVTTTGSMRYVMAARQVYGKDRLPASVFAVDRQSRLVIITCGGPFNRATHRYADNVVVYAMPVPTAPSRPGARAQ